VRLRIKEVKRASSTWRQSVQTGDREPIKNEVRTEAKGMAEEASINTSVPFALFVEDHSVDLFVV